MKSITWEMGRMVGPEQKHENSFTGAEPEGGLRI